MHILSSPLRKKGTDLSVYLKRVSYEYIWTYHVIILHQVDVFFSRFKQIFIFNSLLLPTPPSLTITVIGGSRIVHSPALVTKAAPQRCIPCLGGLGVFEEDVHFFFWAQFARFGAYLSTTSHCEFIIFHKVLAITMFHTSHPHFPLFVVDI